MGATRFWELGLWRARWASSGKAGGTPPDIETPCTWTPRGLVIGCPEYDLGADEGLDTGLAGGLVEAGSTVDSVAVDQRHGRQIERRCPRDEIRTVEHVCAIAGGVMDGNKRGLYHNTDETMRRCAKAALDHVSTLPHAGYAIPEKTPDESALGKGRVLDQAHIQQFGAGSLFGENARS